MPRLNVYKLISLAAVVAFAWLGLRFLLPIAMPFLLGLGLALAAEPMTSLLQRRCRLPRPLCAFFGVSGSLILLSGLLMLLASVLVREAGVLARTLPDLGQSAMSAMTNLQDRLLALAMNTPESVRPVLNRGILELFGSGEQLMEQAVRRVPAAASSVLSHVPGSALTLGTAILSAYMISARLPKLRSFCRERLPNTFCSRFLPALQRLKAALWGWLKAQVKLSGMSFLILLIGFLLLRIPYAPILAAVTAVVDALPVLGCGTVLVPWAVVCLLQGNVFQGLGLLGIYAAVLLTRSALEPRLLGKQLGLDPLVTLMALYAGFKLWGFAGMLLSPLIATAATELAAEAKK